MTSNKFPPTEEGQLSLSFFVCHDLQEPLRKIALFSSMIAEDPKSHLSEESVTYLERIMVSVKRMQHLTDNLLAYSHLENNENEFEKIDLNLIANKVIENLSERIISTEAIINISELPTIKAYPLLISKLFTCLVNNALLYIHPGSPPNITISSSITKENDIEYYKIEFIDSGIGFPQDKALKIFEPFQRLHSKDKYEGSGMSLAICKKIAQMHNGSITAYSTPDKGAVFTILLPIKEFEIQQRN